MGVRGAPGVLGAGSPAPALRGCSRGEEVGRGQGVTDVGVVSPPPPPFSIYRWGVLQVGVSALAPRVGGLPSSSWVLIWGGLIFSIRRP
jgi:hypothetical protein